jgi:hypothetical protein
MSETLRPLIDFEVEVKVSGYKSSEGDGRTAADVEREHEEEHAKRKTELNEAKGAGEDTIDGPE